eukprot:4579257-Alexandrium_andersonii.AAC.1
MAVVSAWRRSTYRLVPVPRHLGFFSTFQTGPVRGWLPATGTPTWLSRVMTVRWKLLVWFFTGWPTVGSRSLAPA